VRTMDNDKTMQEAVASELLWDPKITSDDIRVSASDNAVTLTGHVESYGERSAAVLAAERVYGVKAVADELEVRLPSSGHRDDTEIAEEIARERHWNMWFPDSIDAEVRDGHVTLHGEVDWLYQRAEAERAVQHLAGVRGVTNLLTVKPRVQPDTGGVRQRVEDAIERMADLDARSIRVTMADSTVHLHGHVHSLAERHIAEQAAEAAPGVTAVVNDLTVTP